MLNVGLVGFGYAGKVFHAPVIRVVEGLRLTTIVQRSGAPDPRYPDVAFVRSVDERSEEHTSELQSQSNLVCRLLLEKKKKKNSDGIKTTITTNINNSICS